MCAKRNTKLIKLICAHTGKERAAINSNLRLLGLFALAVPRFPALIISAENAAAARLFFNCQIDAPNINFNYRWMKYLTID
jgi:hypothetical protein